MLMTTICAKIMLALQEGVLALVQAQLVSQGVWYLARPFARPRGWSTGYCSDVTTTLTRALAAEG
jgi:hypothetical protein